MAHKISLDYEDEWKVPVTDNPSTFKFFETPAFSPLPDKSVTFCFKGWYQQINHRMENSKSLSLFKLKLVKLSSVNVSPTLEVITNVNIHGFTKNNTRTLPTRVVNNMNECSFQDVIVVDDQFYYMPQRNVTIKCKMSFYDGNATTHFTSGMDSLSFDKNLHLMKNLKTMYNNPGLFCDFAFKVGDKTFSAHKVVLAAHSPVFKNMLTQEFKESKHNEANITDATPDIFNLFLKYLYSAEIEDKSWDTIKELYYLANKYDVQLLKNECLETIICLLCVDLVCEILQLAYYYSDSRLKDAAINYATNHIKEIKERDDWKELVETNSKIGYEVTVNFIPE